MAFNNRTVNPLLGMRGNQEDINANYKVAGGLALGAVTLGLGAGVVFAFAVGGLPLFAAATITAVGTTVGALVKSFI